MQETDEKYKKRRFPLPEIQKIYDELLIPTSIRLLYLEIANEDHVLQLHEFRDFLKQYQHDDISDDQLRPMVVEFQKWDGFQQILKGVNNTVDIDGIIGEFDEYVTIGLHGFAEYFRSYANIISTKTSDVYQDMTQPLIDYWTASSHNTYLEGAQVGKGTSVDAYRNVLNSCCRCVEIDCWDSSDGSDEPEVRHGMLTTCVKFKNVIEVINQFAFERSHYPLCISVEIHCDDEHQKKMATYLKTILGEKLITKPVNQAESAHPSPAQLLDKIFVKGKKKIVTQELADLIIYTQSCSLDIKKENYWQHAKNTSDFHHINSLSDEKCLSLCKKEGDDIVRHTSRQFVRVYPSAHRVDSSNYDPIIPWAVGCQMVALNYQTGGEKMLLNKAKFRINGNTGYVLKPDFLRFSNGKFNPFDIKTYPRQKPIEYIFKVISVGVQKLIS